MRKAVIALVAAGLIALASAVPTFAHQAPCDESTPGHSSYALHHVAPLAKEGGISAHDHLPGSHRGYAGLCGVLAP